MSDESKPGLGAACTGAIFSLIAWPFLVAWHSYVLLTLWGWFLTPLNLPFAPPSIYTLAGTIMVLRLCLPTPPLKTVTTDHSSFTLALYAFTYPLFALGAGWVWQWLHWWA